MLEYATRDYRAISDESLPDLTASTQLFANAPEGTKEIWLTVRTATLTMTLDGSNATTTNGHDFAVNSSSTPYVLPLNQAQAKLCRAIRNGGATAGHITYRG